MNKRVYFSGKYNFNDEKYVLKAYKEEDLRKKINKLLYNRDIVEKYKKQLKDNLKFFLFHKEGYSPTRQIVSDIMNIIKE